MNNLAKVTVLFLCLLMLVSCVICKAAAKKMVACLFAYGPQPAKPAPIFALYDDDTIIFAKRGKGPSARNLGQYGEYFTDTLSKSSVARVLRLMAEVKRLQHRYVVRTDGGTNVIWYRSADGTFATEVWGDLYGSDKSKGPAAFVRAFDELSNFHSPHPHPWMADKLILVLAEGGESKQANAWPVAWPPLDASRVEIPISERDRFFRLLQSSNLFFSKGHYRIVDHYSIELPGELDMYKSLHELGKADSI